MLPTHRVTQTVVSNDKVAIIPRWVLWLFLLLISTPLVHYASGALPATSLYNVPKVAKITSFTFTDILDPVYRRNLEQSFMQRSGVWEYFVKIHNTINLHLFNIVSSRYRGETMMGAQHALQDRVYVLDRNGLPHTSGKRLWNRDPDQQARDLKRIQDYFEEKGKVFYVLLHPVKTLVHPEWVSSDIIIDPPQERAYPKLEQALARYQVKTLHFDPPSQRKELPLFTKSGAHMTSYGKCLSAKMVADALLKIRPNSFLSFSCELSGALIPPEHGDLDLVRLLNAWWTDTYTSPVPEFSIKQEYGQISPRLSLYVAGTSYMFGLLDVFHSMKVFSTTEFIFYKKSRYVAKNLGTDAPVKKAKPFSPTHHEPSFALQADVIIVEATESRAHQLGFGFVDKMIAYLDAQATAPHQ